MLVTIDTLRADRLGSYGNHGLPTPNLDRLAAEGTMAPDAMVHVPLTRPSHFSLFSGLLPSEHGIRDNVSNVRAPETPLLAEVLQTAGFRTAAFVSSIVLASHTGLNRGFDTYSDEFETEAGRTFFASELQRRGDETVEEAVSWLESNAPGPEARLFAWIHLYDPHEPYDPPEPYASRYAERPYEGEIAWTDELVGRIDAALTRLELRDQTLLTVTADHGEGMGEHREATHGFFIYQSTLAVPLLFRGPGVMPGGRLPVTVRTIDLLPTFLELVGVPAPAGATFPGQSLAAALQGQEPPPAPVTYAETLEPRLHYGWSDLRSVREGKWKYIQAPRPELYDLENDPGERRNLVEVEPSRVEALQASLGRILAAESTARGPGSSGASLPLDLREKLGALGYMGGAGAADPGADPKDKIDDFKLATDLMQRGLVRLDEEDFAGSVELFQDLLGLGVRSFELHFYLARSLLALKRHREAAVEFEQAVGFEPGYPSGWEGLADCRVVLGDLRGAVEAIRSGQESSPRDARLRKREARLWRRLGEPEKARRAYESALPLAPDDALLRVHYGELLRDTGEVEEAIRRLREAVELDPEPASYWNSLGMVLGSHGRLAEAGTAFSQARERDDSNAQYAYNSGLVLLRLGRPQEARGLFEKTLELEPGFEAARLRLAEIGP